MPYPEFLIAPMREELTDVGFTELRTASDVGQFFAHWRDQEFGIRHGSWCSFTGQRPAYVFIYQIAAATRLCARASS